MRLTTLFPPPPTPTTLMLTTFSGPVSNPKAMSDVYKRQVTPAAAKQRMQVKGLTLTDPAVGQPAKAAEGQELALEQLLTLMQALDQRGMTADVSLLDMSDPAQLTLRYLGRFRCV